MTTARRPGALALLGALALALSSCSLCPPGTVLSSPPTTSSPSGSSAAGMFGYFGHGSTTVAADTISTRFELPNGAEIYETTDELDPAARDLIEERAGKYVAWEGKLSQKTQNPCTDLPSTGVEITGSITHESSVQDCRRRHTSEHAEAIRARCGARAVRAARTPCRRLSWTIEIRPWTEDGPVGGGPDDSAPVEDATCSPRPSTRSGWGISAENTPAGWGADLAPDEGNGAPLGWDTTGLVLIDLNAYLLNQDKLGCGDQTGQIRVTKQGNPAQTWTHRLRPGQHSEVLAQTLRGL